MSCHKVKKSYSRKEVRSLHIVIPITKGLEKKIEKVGGGGDVTKKITLTPKYFLNAM